MRSRRQLSQVHLAGPPRRVQHVLASLRIVAVLTAVVAFFLPWHVVHPLSSGSWGDAFCWAPDCHPASMTPEPPQYGPQYTCTGWSHSNTVLPLMLLGVLLVISCVPFRRPRFGVAFALAIVGPVVMIALAYSLFDLKHLFDHTELLFGQRLFERVGGLLVFSVMLDLVATPLLYSWARARLLAT